jgi:hypothetical protein
MRGFLLPPQGGGWEPPPPLRESAPYKNSTKASEMALAFEGVYLLVKGAHRSRCKEAVAFNRKPERTEKALKLRHAEMSPLALVSNNVAEEKEIIALDFSLRCIPCPARIGRKEFDVCNRVGYIILTAKRWERLEYLCGKKLFARHPSRF